ncbi:hypothetical protein T4D_7384 [Trichinella pseudospiralis]|uniref:Uncharacterized protein n=1 Tax=Trichinella pseudospiralis TaxID=6337 RepID=A0A0V1FX70_TRIPS|nr:hypothetical protein T4D_7384 [Trichinella pseudospiralis]
MYSVQLMKLLRKFRVLRSFISVYNQCTDVEFQACFSEKIFFIFMLLIKCISTRVDNCQLLSFQVQLKE